MRRVICGTARFPSALLARCSPARWEHFNENFPSALRRYRLHRLQLVRPQASCSLSTSNARCPRWHLRVLLKAPNERNSRSHHAGCARNRRLWPHCGLSVRPKPLRPASDRCGPSGGLCGPCGRLCGGNNRPHRIAPHPSVIHRMSSAFLGLREEIFLLQVKRKLQPCIAACKICITHRKTPKNFGIFGKLVYF